MWEFWFIGGAIILCVGLCAASVILTMTRKEESPLDQIYARQEKIEALLDSAEVWKRIGSKEESDACLYEASRLNDEIYSILGIHN